MDPRTKSYIDGGILGVFMGIGVGVTALALAGVMVLEGFLVFVCLWFAVMGVYVLWLLAKLAVIGIDEDIS